MKQYRINALVKGYYMRGHRWGSYDIEVSAWFEAVCDAYAEDEARAVELVKEFSYDLDQRNPYDLVVEEVEIKKVQFCGEAPEIQEELVEVDYGKYEEDEEPDFWDEVDRRYKESKEL